MPNPQQPEIARSRRSAATPEDAAPSTPEVRSRGRGRPAGGGVAPVPPANEPGHQPEEVPDKPTAPTEPYRLPTQSGGEWRGDQLHYRFAFEPLLVPFAAAAGVVPATSWVRVDDDRLEIRFGPWVLRTDRSNIAGCEVTGPYRFVKVAGPPHFSFADRGITFATNRQAGVCIRFDEPVGFLPRVRLRHPAATVTVAEPEGLADLLPAAG